MVKKVMRGLIVAFGMLIGLLVFSFIRDSKLIVLTGVIEIVAFVASMVLFGIIF